VKFDGFVFEPAVFGKDREFISTATAPLKVVQADDGIYHEPFHLIHRKLAVTVGSLNGCAEFLCVFGFVHIFGLVSVSLAIANAGLLHAPPGAQVFFIGAVNYFTPRCMGESQPEP
jgi:hypothetical protein